LSAADAQKTEIAIRLLVLWLGISLSKFYDWRKRYGKVNEHNAKIPRDHWLTDEEKRAILDYEREYPLEGYRRLTFMMLDDDVAAASPATVYGVLKSADRLGRPSPSNERRGKGFHQPSRPHRHWQIDLRLFSRRRRGARGVSGRAAVAAGPSGGSAHAAVSAASLSRRAAAHAARLRSPRRHRLIQS